jgi:hypothetical protein
MLEMAAESRIHAVQVYARGAQVTRRATVAAAPAGELELVVAGVTTLAEAGSLRAETSNGRGVVALRSALVLTPGPVAPGPSLARLREAGLRLERLVEEQKLLDARRRALLGVPWQPHIDARDRRLDPARRTADALAVGALCGDLAAGFEPRLRELETEIEQARRQLEAVKLEDAQASARERGGADRPTREVRVRLAAGGEGPLELTLTYVVSAARWWPAYAARLAEAGARAELELAAYVVQASGEDWDGVALSLSTADLIADARLPELPSLRWSRRQPPARRGYRPAPPGLDQMFEGYERSAPPAPPAPAKVAYAAAAGPAPAAEMVAGGPPPPPQAPPPMQTLAAPVPTAAAPMIARMAKSAAAAPAPAAAMPASFGAAPGGGGGPPQPVPAPAPPPPAAIEPADAWMDFDGLEMADGDAGRERGRLRRAAAPSDVSMRAQAAQAVEVVRPPMRTIDPRSSRGKFDHRYQAAAALDVPADARPHRVPLARAQAPARPRFVTVPREAAEVYREVQLDNPFGAPLLPGPCEVFMEGVLLTTTQLDEVDKGGTVQLGLGVEDRLRVARNARAEEQTAGLLGGSTSIEHKVTIDVRSALGLAVTVDVLDRVPVSDDDDIEIAHSARPAAEAYEQRERGEPVRGGLRWRVPVPAGGKAQVELSYRIKLPSKNEIVGGNRRE